MPNTGYDTYCKIVIVDIIVLLYFDLLADQQSLIHCRATEPVLGQVIEQLWAHYGIAQSGLEPSKLLATNENLYKLCAQVYGKIVINNSFSARHIYSLVFL